MLIQQQQPRLGEIPRSMKRTVLCALATLAASGGAGCATVNMGAIGDEPAAVDAAVEATAEQRRLYASSDAFQARAEEAGWAERGSAGAAARRAVDVLIHGRDSADGPDKDVLTPAERFIEARGYDAMSGADAVVLLAAEIREARVGVRAVNAAAAQVVVGPERPSWSRRDDVAAAEAVVQLARRSRTLFRDVRSRLDDRMNSSERARIAEEFDAFDLELDRLSEAADALSRATPDVELRDVDIIAALRTQVG